MLRRSWIAILLLAVVASTAAAQTPEASHWGVTGSFVPTWKIPPNVTYLYEDATKIDVKGSDFTIGVARGRAYGGDWGLTYLHRTFKDGSYFEDIVEMCPGANARCVNTGTRYTLQTVTLDGIQAHKFVSFVTIKKVAQIGMIFGGGVGWAKGYAEGTYSRVIGWNQTGPIMENGTEQVKYTDVTLGGFLSVVPIGQVELAGNAILAPGLKVRFSGGYNFPGYQVARISVVYLIGAH